MHLSYTSRVGATEGRRHWQRAHLTRQPNEKPAGATTSSKSNLLAGTRAECEEEHRKEDGCEEEEENGDTWNDERSFILVRSVSRIPKSRLGWTADKVQ